MKDFLLTVIDGAESAIDGAAGFHRQAILLTVLSAAASMTPTSVDDRGLDALVEASRWIDGNDDRVRAILAELKSRLGLSGAAGCDNCDLDDCPYGVTMALDGAAAA